MAILTRDQETLKVVLKLLESYIDRVQAAMAIKDYREVDSETDNVCAILNNIKIKYGLK